MFCVKESGKDFNRKAYNLLAGTEISASMLRKDDLLIICSIDRLGRNYTEITKEWQRITKEIGAHIRVLDMSLLDTSNPDHNLDQRFIADLVLQILSYVAEKERINTRTRQAEGIKIAREKGTHLGRPRATFPDNWEAVYQDWKAGKNMSVDAMNLMRLKKATFYNLVKRYEAEVIGTRIEREKSIFREDSI